MVNKLLTIKELCEVLQTSRRNVMVLRGLGLPTYMLSVNGHPRFDLDEVKKWMSENAARSRSKEKVTS